MYSVSVIDTGPIYYVQVGGPRTLLLFFNFLIDFIRLSFIIPYILVISFYS